jgi:hypothetical protein
MLGVLSDYFSARRIILEESEELAKTQFTCSLTQIETVISKQAEKMYTNTDCSIQIFNPMFTYTQQHQICLFSRFISKVGTLTLENIIHGTKSLTDDLRNDGAYLKGIFSRYR